MSVIFTNVNIILGKLLFSIIFQKIPYFIFLKNYGLLFIQEIFSLSSRWQCIPLLYVPQGRKCSNYRTVALISHASKVMLKILQARLQQYMNRELPDVQAGFRKGRGTRDQTAKSVGSSKNQENSRKTSTSALLTMPKPLTVWATTNCGKF